VSELVIFFVFFGGNLSFVVMSILHYLLFSLQNAMLARTSGLDVCWNNHCRLLDYLNWLKLHVYM